MNLAEIDNSNQLSAVTGRRRRVPYATIIEGQIPSARESFRTAALDKQRDLSLAQSAQQFQEEQALQEEELAAQKKQATTASAIAGANLAVTTAYTAKKLGWVGSGASGGSAAGATAMEAGASGVGGGAGATYGGAQSVQGGGQSLATIAAENEASTLGGQSALQMSQGAPKGGPTLGGAAGVLAIVAAADMIRKQYGQLDRPYEERSPMAKFASAPVTGGPPALFKAAGLKDSTYIAKVNNEMAKAEERLVGQPLDKAFSGDIFGSIGDATKAIIDTPRTVWKVITGCFAAGTPVRMAGDTTKAVEDIELFDETLEGGVVTGRGEVLSNDMYDYNDVRLSGEHAVLENGRWLRIKESHAARPVGCVDYYERVYPIVTEHHILIVGDTVFADYAETDHGTHVNDAYRLNWLNEQTDRNRRLEEKYDADLAF